MIFLNKRLAIEGDADRGVLAGESGTVNIASHIAAYIEKIVFRGA